MLETARIETEGTLESTTTRRAGTRLLAGGAALAVLLAGACRGEDRPSVEVIGGGGVVSVSGAPEGEGPAQPSGRRYAYSVEPTLDLAAPLDLRALRAVINVAIDGRPVDWPQAVEVYAQGRNQKRADGALRTLATLAAEPGVLAVFPNGSTVYGRTSFIDGLTRDGLNGTGRAQGLSDDARRAIVDGGVQMLFYAKSLENLGVARERLDARAAGAAPPVDSAWAFVAGPLDGEDRPSGLLPAMFKIEAAFKLEQKLVQPMELAFIDALSAAEKGDASAFAKHAAAARGHLNAYFYLSALRAAKAAEGDTTEAARQTHLAEAWVAFQTIRATATGASPSAAPTVEASLSRPGAQAFPASETRKVYEALNDAAVLQALGVPTALQVKTPPAGA